MKPMRGFGRAFDRISIYLPIILMGLLALGTYWLARTTPTFAPAAPERAPTHDPDYFLRGFSVKSFDPSGRLKTEKRRVMPFDNPAFGIWRLQFDTHRRFDKDRERKRVIPVRVYRG